jgi:nicotinate-nucleotide--dimethylbenzimidazole phosphoribosyltransferase
MNPEGTAPPRRTDLVLPPDGTAARECTEAVRQLSPGLGRLPAIAGWVAGAQGVAVPRPLRRVRAVVVSSPEPAATTAADGIRRSTRAVAALAEGIGAAPRLVDVVTDAGDDPARLVPELPSSEFEAAYELGRFVADEEADAGTELLIAGVDARTAEVDLACASALVAALLDREPVAVVGTDSGRGSVTGMDDLSWARRVTAARDALRRTRRLASPEPEEVLRLVGGARLAVVTGLLAQAAVRRTPVLLDGTSVAAAALAAARLAPGAEGWWIAAGHLPEPAAAMVFGELGLEPLLDLGVRVGDGSGALLALPLLHAAMDLVSGSGRDAAEGR